jgi:glycine hydroxymethyltransferase
MSHIAGLVAGKAYPSPFLYADVVTTTTHKTLRGPRAGLIFFRKELQQQIDDAVFPGLQGGPHQNQIGAIATQLKEVATPEFCTYMEQVRSNARAFASALEKKGYTIVTGGTDNHLFLVDLRNKGISGGKAEKILEYVNISVNKNTIPGDVSALNPSGIRIGTPAMTTRGLKETDMGRIADILDRVLQIGVQIQTSKQTKTIREFAECFSEYSELHSIREEIHQWMSSI